MTVITTPTTNAATKTQQKKTASTVATTAVTMAATTAATSFEVFLWVESYIIFTYSNNTILQKFEMKLDVLKSSSQI